MTGLEIPNNESFFYYPLFRKGMFTHEDSNINIPQMFGQGFGEVPPGQALHFLEVFSGHVAACAQTHMYV